MPNKIDYNNNLNGINTKVSTQNLTRKYNQSAYFNE